MADLRTLPNIGEKLAAELGKAGITDAGMLVELGSIEAALRIAQGRPFTGYNLLYALEGAVRGVRWHSLGKEELARVRAAFDARKAAG